MQATANDTDILIVGAGPVGLFLANECARRGLRYRLIEARSTQSEHSKALAIFSRTLEIFDMAGVVAPFLQAANRVTRVTVSTHGETLARMNFHPDDSPYTFIAMVPQNVTENLLVQELRRKGGDVEYETTFVSGEQHESGVTATLDKKGKSSTVTAAFVVGCDGAHSAVRHLLNMPFEGAQYSDAFLLADVDNNHALPADELQLCPNESGPLAIFPISSSRSRIVATIDHSEEDAPSLDLVKKILAQRGPRGFEALALHWSAYFRIHHRHVAQLRSGRFFLAGDAAHIHSPFGGQGMNTGLQDIWNLAWKLDLFLRGLGNQPLLDSYSSERIPIIKSVIQTTHLLTRFMGTPSKFAQAIRNAVLPMVSRLAPFQHAFVERLSELGIAYGESPIIEGPGKRYFDDSLRGGSGIGGKFMLFVEEGEALRFAKQSFQPLSALIEVRPSRESGIQLVRPDGYLAYATDSGDVAKALAAVQDLLKRQTDLPQIENIRASA